MEIKLGIDEINSIFQMAKPFINKRDVRPAFTQISIRLKDNVLSAIALDGSSMGVIQIPYKDENAQDGSMMIPRLPLFKKKGDVYCAIMQDERETTFKTALQSQSFPRVSGDPFVNYERFLPKNEKKESTYYFDPERLSAALSAFSGCKSVKIDCYGPLGGFLITDADGGRIALVLPIHPKKWDAK